MKIIDIEYKFLKVNKHLENLRNAAIKAILHWKSLETKLPKDVEIAVNQIIKGEKCYSVTELDSLLYNSLYD